MSFSDAAKALMPPGDPVTTWRWTMAITVGVVAAVLALHITGVIQGNTGYVTTAQFETLLKSQTESRIDDIERAILDLKGRHCAATDEDTKRFYVGLISKEKRKYQKITGFAYLVPTCGEILG